MTPETLDRFRKRFRQLYLDNPEAEALAQAGCTLVGEIERLTRMYEGRVLVSSETESLRLELVRSKGEAARERIEIRGELDEAKTGRDTAIALVIGFREDLLKERGNVERLTRERDEARLLVIDSRGLIDDEGSPVTAQKLREAVASWGPRENWDAGKGSGG